MLVGHVSRETGKLADDLPTVEESSERERAWTCLDSLQAVRRALPLSSCWASREKVLAQQAKERELFFYGRKDPSLQALRSSSLSCWEPRDKSSQHMKKEKIVDLRLCL